MKTKDKKISGECPKCGKKMGCFTYDDGSWELVCFNCEYSKYSEYKKGGINNEE